ncbi:MAG: fibronectin type III domain-containing protein [Eubacterium sp.]
MMSDSGSNPAFSHANYVSRTGSYGNYTYTWKSGATPQKYIDDFNNYLSLYESDVVEPSIKSYKDLYDIFASFSEFQGLAEVDAVITAAGTKIIEEQSVSAAEVKAAIEKHNSLSATAKQLYDNLSSRSDSRLLPYAKNAYTIDTITPELAYTKPSSVATYKLSDLMNKCNDFLNDLLLQEFNEYIQNADLDKKTDKMVKTAQEKYVALPSEFKNKISSEVFEKFMQLIKPDKNLSNLSDQVTAFQKTKVTLPEIGKDGGVQYAVDRIWDLVAVDILPLISSDIKLQDGLDNILESKVYTNEMVSKIFALYATLSHNETVVVESPKLTLGAVIGLVASPTNIAKMLEEDKYSAAAEKIKPYSSFKDTDTMNKFDALAAEKFENGDFGFEDGDREGFFDALLAVLRPITSLLAPGAKAAGLVAINANMFDYVTDEGEYVEGAYAHLIPILEQIGLTSLPTVEEYKKDYYDTVEKQSTAIAADRLVRPIIDSLLTDVLDMVSPDPLNGIIKIIPRLAYVISTDMLNDNVKAALGQLGMLSGLAGSLDLSAQAINDKLTSSPIDLTSLAGTECKIHLKAIDWEKLANCATVKSTSSVSNSNAYFVLRTGDTETCFTTVFYYVYSIAFADSENYSTIKTLLNSLLGGTIAGIVTGITDKFAGKNFVDGYGDFLSIFNSALIELPDVEPLPEISLIPEKKISAKKCTAKLSCNSYNYNGKTHKPSVTVKYGKKALKNGTDYTVQYVDSCKNTGKHAVMVVFKGEYTGIKYLYFNIKPKSTTIKSVKAGKKSFTVKWKKNASQTTGYQIQYCTSKSFKNAKTVTVNSTSTVSKKVSGLKAKKKYYVRVRTYKHSCGVKTYSAWSKAKTVTVKK